MKEEIITCDGCGEEFPESDLHEGTEVGRPGDFLCDECWDTAYDEYPDEE